jgi:hypothetical protein
MFGCTMICQSAGSKGNLLHCEMSVIENYSCFGELKKGCQNCNACMLFIYLHTFVFFICLVIADYAFSLLAVKTGVKNEKQKFYRWIY